MNLSNILVYRDTTMLRYKRILLKISENHGKLLSPNPQGYPLNMLNKHANIRNKNNALNYHMNYISAENTITLIKYLIFFESILHIYESIIRPSFE